jgi:F0F1-type ATP synthase epsilon subunit
MRRSFLRAVTTSVVGALVASGALLGGNATVAGAAPTVPTGAVTVAPAARLWVGPVHPLVDNTTAAVSVDFDSPNTYKSRQVSVQYEKTPDVWVSFKVAKMDKSGKLTVKVGKDHAAAPFRAVALAGTYKKKAFPVVATPSTQATVKWVGASYDFGGSALPSDWAPRDTGADHEVTGSRQCSATSPTNVAVGGGLLGLTLKRASVADTKKRQVEVAVAKRDAAIASANKAIAAAKSKLAAAKTSKAKKAATAKLKAAEKQLAKAKKMSTTKGCPQGVFTNAMIATGEIMTSGIVAAKIKFPKGKGMHGSAWLQSSDGQEIDFIESYGLGKGITNVVHRRSGSKLVRSPSTAAKSYVLKSAASKSSWWAKYHVFSVEFDKSKLIFRIDGKVTRTMKGMADRHYFLVLSLLSSDWELPLLKSSSVPSKMQVDWVRVWTKA